MKNIAQTLNNIYHVCEYDHCNIRSHIVQGFRIQILCDFNITERTSLENGEITKRGFIELNEMEAEDSQGDVEDLWITLTSMGLNKALIMDEVSMRENYSIISQENLSLWFIYSSVAEHTVKLV